MLIVSTVYLCTMSCFFYPVFSCIALKSSVVALYILDYNNIGIFVFNVMLYSVIKYRGNFSRKEPMVGQRGTLGRVKIRIIALKSRAMSQYGGGMGGVLSIRKNSANPPANLRIYCYEFVF